MGKETEQDETPQETGSETEDKKDEVQEQSEDSFPASDPPSY